MHVITPSSWAGFRIFFSIYEFNNLRRIIFIFDQKVLKNSLVYPSGPGLLLFLLLCIMSLNSSSVMSFSNSFLSSLLSFVSLLLSREVSTMVQV